MPQRIRILGVPVDCVTRKEALQVILSFLQSGGQYHVITPNPEMLVEARKNAAFKDVLLHSALNVPDGVGLLWAARWRGIPLSERVAGVDLLMDLCLSPSAPPVFLLGAAPGVAERAAVALRSRNPALVVAGTYGGSPDAVREQAIIDQVNASGARILFVAFGAPKQDLWIARALPRMPGIRLAMGVGGAFDFIAGERRRAPAALRAVGLEWLWRLLLEPRRIGRIVNAVVVFPLLVLCGDART